MFPGGKEYTGSMQSLYEVPTSNWGIHNTRWTQTVRSNNYKHQSTVINKKKLYLNLRKQIIILKRVGGKIVLFTDT